jgi:hypothetical protein
MSAPTRKQPQTTVWLRPRASSTVPAAFPAKVLAYVGAGETFQKLTDAGLNENLLWRHLWGLAWLKKASAKQKSPWYALTALPPRTFAALP